MSVNIEEQALRAHHVEHIATAALLWMWEKQSHSPGTIGAASDVGLAQEFQVAKADVQAAFEWLRCYGLVTLPTNGPVAAFLTSQGVSAAQKTLTYKRNEMDRTNNTIINNGTITGGVAQAGSASNVALSKNSDHYDQLLEGLDCMIEKLDLAPHEVQHLRRNLTVIDREMSLDRPNRPTVNAALQSIKAICAAAGNAVLGAAATAMVDRVLGRNG